jgi:hypothetical protein
MTTTFKPNRLSAVSSIIRVLENEIAPKAEQVNGFKFVVADNLFHRLNAYRLGYNEYLKKGYIEENQYQALMNDLDLDAETLTVVAYHGTKEVGTITVNTQDSLPFEEIFDCEMAKDPNFKGAELTRLAIDEDYRNNKEILLGMFNLIFAYSSFVKNCSHLVIEVNPRHVKFYERILGFTAVAENVSCPRVRGAPAVLLMGDLKLPMIYPENYKFLATGEERETMIQELSNINPLMKREIEILARMHQQIKFQNSMSSVQIASY